MSLPLVINAPRVREEPVTRPDAPVMSYWTTVDGLAMHARVSAAPVSSAGLPVILVHGLIVSSRYMVPLIRRLGTTHRVYAPDLPGFGRSAAPADTLDIPGLADALAAWLRAVGIGRAVLVGNSMGCQIIVDLAARYPALVDRVILQGPSIDGRARSVVRQVTRLLRDQPREPVSLLPILARDVLDAGPRRGLATFSAAMRYPMEPVLPRVQAPALVVRSVNDPIASQEWVEDVANRLPRGRVVLLPVGAHVVHSTHPDLFARLVRAFMSVRHPLIDRLDGVA